MKILAVFLFFFIFFSLVGAELDVAKETQDVRGVNIITPDVPTNFSIQSVNASEFWITNVGDLDNVNATQFTGDDGVLTILESWLRSLRVNIFDQQLNMTSNVTKPRIVEAEPVTLPAWAAVTWSATDGIKFTPIRIVINPSNNLPKAINKSND